MRQSALRTSLFSVVFTLFFFAHSTNSFAGELTKNVTSIFDEISHQELVEIDLHLDMGKMMADRKSMEKFPAIFSFKNKEGITQDWNIKVHLRGHFRRLKCENMPPLKLNFKKSDLKEAGFSDFDDLKLVTHCMNDPEMAKKLLVREYLAYKMYNVITTQSYRVQFVKINYRDTKSENVTTQFGILIEDTAQLRNRMQATKEENAYNFPRERFNIQQVKVVSVFNYMIGNSDWSISAARNVKILSKNGKNLLVPYDFDFSGVVDAPYAVLKKEHGISSTKDRVFLGFDEDYNDLSSTVKYFQKKKPQILQVIRDCNLIGKKDKRILLKYINSFFTEGNI